MISRSVPFRPAALQSGLAASASLQDSRWHHDWQNRNLKGIREKAAGAPDIDI